MKRFAHKQPTLKQMLSTLTLAVSIALLTACGGGGSDNHANNQYGNQNSNPSDKDGQNGNGNGNQNGNDQSQQLAIDESYASPNYPLKNNIINIGSHYLNQHNDINTQLLNYKSSNQPKDYNQLFEQYLSQLLLVTKSADDTPSYAPRGELKFKLIDVVNGKLDYSGYVLKGDFNNDGLIDFNDIEDFKKALYAQDPAQLNKYDINGDGVLDTKDLLELISQLFTDISYYDFYSPSGQKLNIPIRKYTEDKVIDYNGSETQILVVAKDINKASSFTDKDAIKLSDLDKVWYKNTGKAGQVGVYANNSASSSPTAIRTYANASELESMENILIDNENFDFTNAQQQTKQQFLQQIDGNLLNIGKIDDDKYLIGYVFVAKMFSVAKGFDQTVNLNAHKSTLEAVKSKIKGQFNTDLGRPLQENSKGQPERFVYAIGQTKGYREKNNIPGKIKHTKVKAIRKAIKLYRQVGKQKVYQRIAVDIGSVAYLSQKEERLSAKVLDLAGGKVKGTLSSNRYGPLPVTFSKDTEGSGQFNVNNIPWGGYNFEFKNECGCSVPIEPSQDDFITENKDITFNITQMQKDISVKLNYKDKNGKPIKNKRVHLQETSKCRTKGHALGSMVHKTDDNGVVRFSNFTSGEFLVNGKKYNFCENTDKDMTGKNLWDIKVDFNAHYLDTEVGSPTAGQYLDDNIIKTYEDVEIFSKDDAITANIPVGTELNKMPELPYKSGWMTYLSFFSKSGEELEISYSNEGISIAGGRVEPNKYCIQVTSNRAYYSGNCLKINGSDGFLPQLSEAEAQKLENHEAFTFSEEAFLNVGKTETVSLHMEFTPK